MEDLPSSKIEYTEERVKEFLKLAKLPPAFFREKLCSGVECGSGRYTYAMLNLVRK